MPARARASAIARPTRTAPPVTSARGRCGVILESVMSSRVKNWFKVRFIAGFFFTVPVFLTAWLLWIFWSRIDDVFFPMYEKIFGRAVPGLGFLTAIAIILLLGTIARNVDRKSTRLNSSHLVISYAVFCLKKKKSHNRYLD